MHTTSLFCRVKVYAFLFALFCFFHAQVSAYSYRLAYREELYELHHRQLYAYPIDIAENIYWLETALRADFANPLHALARIENEAEWAKYRALFTLHINLKLVELYLLWASRYYKFEAYFYNAPWREENLESLEQAELLMELALVYWYQALDSAELAGQYPWIFLEEQQFWEDELFRIQTERLNYEEIIAKHQERLENVRAAFLQMAN